MFLAVPFRFLSALAAAIAASCVLSACWVGEASSIALPESTAIDEPVGVPAATRTVVSFGPGNIMVTEVVRVGDDAHAVTDTIAGPFGEEIVVGDDHYVRLDALGPTMGVDGFIHFDLSDPFQREHLRRHPAGLIATADLVDTPVGGRIGRSTVVAVARPAPGVVVIDLDDGSEFTFTVEPLDIRPTIGRPDPEDIVHLRDLPDLIEWPDLGAG